MAQRVQRPPSPFNLPEVSMSGVPGWLYRFCIAIKQRLESILIRRNGPSLPFGQTLEGHTIVTGDRNTAVPISINGEVIGTGLQVHQSADAFTFTLMTNGSPSGVAFFLAVKDQNEASIVSDRTSASATYVPITMYAHGVPCLQIASTLSISSTNLVSPVFIRFSGAMTQVKFYDDGAGHRILYV